MGKLPKKAKTVEEIIRTTRMPHGFAKDKWVPLNFHNERVRELQKELLTWKIAADSAVKERDHYLSEKWKYGERIGELEGQLGRIRETLKEFEPKFTGKCKAGPPSDYQDLWSLIKDFTERLGCELSGERSVKSE